ncbi:MAG: hypothetical protein JNL59_01750, partial [Chitinophagaceae bacterium]|nr:hypothetical protein [Chitinophagaceae bacterium]
MQAFLRKLNRFFVQGTKSPRQLPPSEVAVDERTYEKYSFIIGSVIAYFNDLSSASKRKFVNRVHHFRQLKKFHFIGLENTEDIAILVSASAVQITFGLKDYYLHSFKDIYI